MILTKQDAMKALRITSDDECPQLQTLMDACDAELEAATGFDWGTLTAKYQKIEPIAKMAATMLIIHLYEGTELLSSYNSFIGQLHAKFANNEVS